jgi:hypothetical protein
MCPVTSDTRLRTLAVLAAVLAVPIVIVWWPGCRQYPPVTSRESLSLMRLLNTACNTKDAVRLAKAEKQFQSLDRAGKLAPKERAAFESIISHAKAGDWESAETAAYKMAEDQIGLGKSNAP